MPDTADFAYDGHVVLSVKTQQAPLSSQSIVIKKIENLIPINVTCEIDSEEHVLTAYIDYSTHAVYLPQETSTVLSDPEMFKTRLVDYLVQGSEEYTRILEEEYASQNVDRDQVVPNNPADICPNRSTV